MRTVSCNHALSNYSKQPSYTSAFTSARNYNAHMQIMHKYVETEGTTFGYVHRCIRNSSLPHSQCTLLCVCRFLVQ